MSTHHVAEHHGVQHEAGEVKQGEIVQAAGPSALDQLVQDEFAALEGFLTSYQLHALESLIRLRHSLRGPQGLLEAAGLNRPPFLRPSPGRGGQQYQG